MSVIKSLRAIILNISKSIIGFLGLFFMEIGSSSRFYRFFKVTKIETIDSIYVFDTKDLNDMSVSFGIIFKKDKQ